ncbi:unnamed protein product [Pleuronectes platessa]|uniref:Uncharacterized protein n=1 Tax=Pleuronectes platessa TaxID=8262 RepID=A0A9N7TXW8_PLEPL|nr:unnamed protein product [Pleuronectes platessa]
MSGTKCGRDAAAGAPGRDAALSLPPCSPPSPLLVTTDQCSSSHVSQQQPSSSLPSLPASHELAAIATANSQVRVPLSSVPVPGGGAPGRELRTGTNTRDERPSLVSGVRCKLTCAPLLYFTAQSPEWPRDL